MTSEIVNFNYAIPINTLTYKFPPIRYLKILCSFLAGLFLSPLLLAQKEKPQVKFVNAESFTVNQGLSQGLVSSITQDHFGFMWFGTLDGLNRYDGHKVSVFRHNADDINSISESFVTAIFKDSKNRLWIGTNSSGLNLFDYTTERFISFRHQKDDSNSLSDDRIISINEDLSGALWIATMKGLNKIVVAGKSKVQARDLKTNRPTFLDSNQLTISYIRLDATGRELFSYRAATSGQAFFRPSFFIDHSGKILVSADDRYFSIRPSIHSSDTVIEINRLVAPVEQEEKIKDIISSTHCRYEKGDFLFQLAITGIALIDDRSGLVQLLSASNGKKQINTGSGKENAKLILGFHLYEYNRISQRLTQLRSLETDKDLSLAHSQVLFTDRNGKSWIGTGGYGLITLDENNEKFHRVNSSSVHWLSGTVSGKVIIRDGDSIALLKKNTEGTWERDNNYFRKIYSRLNGRYFGTAIQSGDQKLWLQAEGIHEYRKENLLKTVETEPVSWPALYLDNENTLWFAKDSILCKINPATNLKTQYPIALKHAVRDFYVETIYRDAKQVVWLGTTAGLISFDEKKQQWDQFVFQQNNKHSLSSNLILTICADADSNFLWVGTNGGGFNYFNKKTGACRRFSVRDGLPNDVVYGILTDKAGELWMSTNRGLSNYHPSTQTFENYTVEDGLQGSEFNTHAYCKTSDGVMFFGGVNGYNYFDPAEINKLTSPHPVLVTGVYNNGSEIDFADKGSPLSMPSYLSKTISFQYPDNNVSFDFSGMLFKGSARGKYRYMLEGVDKNWVLSLNNRSAVYANLQPGTYVYKVKTAGAGAAFTSIEVVIHPPWYSSWWFIAILSCFGLGILYVFYMYNLQIEMNRFQDHQRIASDLHDEIGSTLSSIHIYSEVALGKITNKPLEAARYLRQISNNVENTIGSLDDIVWALNVKGDRFEDIGNRMRASAISIAEACDCSLELHFDEELNSLKFGKETRKNLFLIYKEAINNVMKYAGGTRIMISLTFQKKMIVLSVRDDGKGFAGTRSQQGNGLGNMRKRARQLKGNLEIISSPGEGTNVLLEFPYRAGR